MSYLKKTNTNKAFIRYKELVSADDACRNIQFIYRCHMVEGLTEKNSKLLRSVVTRNRFLKRSGGSNTDTCHLHVLNLSK